MQLSTIFATTLFSFVLLLNNYTYGNQIDFPVEACATGVATGNYWSCAGQLALSIWKIHNWSEDTPINICGISCKGNLKGRLSKWQWKWDGRFRCDSKASGIVGHDTKQSRNGAMEWAIKDFLNKAMKSGKIKAEDFRC
jgi:hypothetical protein